MVELILFGIFALIAVLAAVGVVAQRNVVYSALLLVLNFLCLASLYILLNAQLVGVVQIIVYAGALMVLFLFTVMLLAGKRAELVSGGLPGQRVLAPLLVVALAVVGFLLLAGSVPGVPPAGEPVPQGGNVQAVAQLLFTRHLWAFEATAVLLLVAVVGVVYLVRGGEPRARG